MTVPPNVKRRIKTIAAIAPMLLVIVRTTLPAHIFPTVLLKFPLGAAIPDLKFPETAAFRKGLRAKSAGFITVTILAPRRRSTMILKRYSALSFMLTPAASEDK